jgi:ribosome biogenesis ATPase
MAYCYMERLAAERQCWRTQVGVHVYMLGPVVPCFRCVPVLSPAAVATELADAGVTFLRVAGPEVVSGMSGESEANIRALFAEAEACAPALVLIDEIDSIVPKRETAQREMERRIVAQLFSCLEALAGTRVVVIGATNRPDALDAALRTPSRFSKEILLGIPDAEGREQILRVLSKVRLRAAVRATCRA